MNRIYENLADSFGYSVLDNDSYKEFINKIYKVLKMEAEQFAFNNRLENTDFYKRLIQDRSTAFSTEECLHGNITERRSSSQERLIKRFSIAKKGD